MQKIIFTILVSLFSLAAFSADKLLFAVLVTRHGDRAPFATIKNANYDWGSSVAELTPLGMHQEFNLGSNLRKKFVESAKLLPNEYKPDAIFALASNTNRTIMSVQCLLLGLYPPGTGPLLDGKDKPALPSGIQLIPVRTDNSTMILKPYPLYIKILEKYVYNTDKWKEVEESIKPKINKWSKTIGYDIKSLADVLTVGDVLICAKSHNLPYPDGLSQKDANEIISLTEYKLAHQFYVGEVSYLMGGELLNKIENDMESFINEKQPYKLVYYSGHDITLLPIMALLGKPLETAPGYASHMTIELWQNDDSSYSVKVFYDKGYVKLPIMNDSYSCSYDDFKKLISSVNQMYENLKPPQKD